MADPNSMYGEEDIVVLSDDVLTSVANATLVLIDGGDREKLAVLFQFPQFLEHCPDETVNTMVPEICRDAIKWAPRLQMASAEALYYAVGLKLPESVAKRTVVASLRILQTIGSGEVFDAWGEILSMVLPQIQRDDVVQLIVPATKERATSDKVESRRLAARIIGSLVDQLHANEIEEQFLEICMKLMEDPDGSVRAMMAQSLAQVGAALPLPINETKFWPSLNNMLRNDKEARARAAALRALSRSAEGHKDSASSAKSFTEMIVPIFLAECETASKVAASDLRTIDDDIYLMLEIFAEVYGYFIVAVANSLTQDEHWTLALNCLRRMVTCNGPTVRQWCAYNLPALVLTTAHRRPDRVKGVLHALSTDSDVETRGTLANGIHEVVAVLCDNEMLRKETVSALSALITDQNNQVRLNTMQNFALDMENLSKNHPPGEASRELEKVFTSLEMLSQDSWRTQEVLARELGKLAHLCTQEVLCNNVAPVLFQMARESTYLVRKAGMVSLINVVRYIPDVRRRDHILKHFRTQWARGKVYWTRLAFIEGSFRAVDVFSRKLFNEVFAGELYEMVKDPVPNVRLRLVALFKRIGPLFRDVPEFLAALKVLMADTDAQVVADSKAAYQLVLESKGMTEEELKEDLAKEEAEKKFFIQKKKKTADNKPEPDYKELEKPTQKEANPGVPGIGVASERARSFTNRQQSEQLLGAKPTPVTASIGNLPQPPAVVPEKAPDAAPAPTPPPAPKPAPAQAASPKKSGCLACFGG
eukprot:CAMPEP_0182451540 /NCGR_PEP_ID=MMETSP1172-20130603/43777_1 /TAXON_ID=708627 /ORGANISM="Timspurckia oligopyrenoides, Strain CCMP3278" /LENGTH=761 /DNA_ID=CAMNT_0024649323 /DNA_START=254 /DNA_END=2539 /DNA_ORIENTATION=+